MRAAVLRDFGQPVSLTNLPIPEPGQGEVRVRGRASSVNGFDLAVAAGYIRDWMEHRFPVVLGRDFAGTVDALGPGATRFAVGDQVFGVVLKPVLGDGAFGEYTVVSEDGAIAHIPAGLDLPTAGALGSAVWRRVLCRSWPRRTARSCNAWAQKSQLAGCASQPRPPTRWSRCPRRWRTSPTARPARSQSRSTDAAAADAGARAPASTGAWSELSPYIRPAPSECRKSAGRPIT